MKLKKRCRRKDWLRYWFLFVKNIANCLTQIPRFYWLNKVRATAGCELLRVRAARVVTLKNRVRVAAVVRDAVWCEPRGFFSEFIIKKVRAAVGCELLRVRAARVVTLKNRRMWCGPRSGRAAALWVRAAFRCEPRKIM